MVDRSAGLAVWRRSPTASAPLSATTPGAADGAGLELWIAHMGGPFWARKDARAWSIPKGLLDGDEDPLSAALREFEEETGLTPPRPADGSPYEDLGEFRQRSGKIVVAYAVEAPDFDPQSISSNTFPLEWPPRSGRTIEVPEIDRAEWVPFELARERLVAGQVPLLDALLARHGGPAAGRSDAATAPSS